MTGRKTSDGFLCFSLLYKEIMTAPLFLSSGVSIHFWISLSHLLSLLRIWRMACCCITIILRLTTHTCYQFLWIRGPGSLLGPLLGWSPGVSKECNLFWGSICEEESVSTLQRCWQQWVSFGLWDLGPPFSFICNPEATDSTFPTRTFLKDLLMDWDRSIHEYIGIDIWTSSLYCIA